MVARTSRSSARISRSRKRVVESSSSDISDSDLDGEYDPVEDPTPELDQRQNKRARREPAPAQDSNTEEVQLFRALCSPEIAVSELALEWVEQFVEDDLNSRNEAITELINLVLRACGCTQLAQPHDTINYDSAGVTVAEITSLFKRYKYHEYPFISNNKEIKFFRRNVLEFFENVILVAHAKGCLYKSQVSEEDSSLSSHMMSTVLAWLYALSASNTRPFRYVSSSIIFTIQTVLCELVSQITLSLEKQQRQLNTARNSQNRRNQSALKRKIEVITESINNYTIQKNTVMEYMNDVLDNVFIHRYRDVEPSIRSESVKALTQWMLTYGEHFLQANYLRYFGWLLSDPADNVKDEVIKSILKLYRSISGKSETMGAGLRQFSERFKKQLINMLWKESNSNIKTRLVAVHTELYRLGFFEETDVYEVSSLGLMLTELPLPLSSGNTKLKSEICRFIYYVCDGTCRSELENYKVIFEDYTCPQLDSSESGCTFEQCLRFKILVETVEATLAHYRQIKSRQGEESQLRVFPQHLIDRLYTTLSSHGAFEGEWESLMKYILLDVSSLTLVSRNSSQDFDDEMSNSIKKRLSIDSSHQKYVAMSLAAGAVYRILTKSPSATASRDQDDFNLLVPRLVEYIPKLEEFSRSDVETYSTFMNMWSAILITIPSSISRLFEKVSSIEDYNLVHKRNIQFYGDLTSSTEESNVAFETYFSITLKNFGGGTGQRINNDRILNESVSQDVEELLLSITIESIEALLSTEPIEDTNDNEENGLLSSAQKVVVNRLLTAGPALHKLAQISKITNINRFVAEPVLGSSSVLLEVMQIKLLSKINFQEIIECWPTNYKRVMGAMTEAWNAVLFLLSFCFSWKFEDLTYASSDNSASSIDINLFLEDFGDIIENVFQLGNSVMKASRDLNEITSDSNSVRKALLQNLVNLQSNISLHLIDMIVSMRTFYNSFKGDNVFQNFETFFEKENVKGFVQDCIPIEVEDLLMNVFFIEEAQFAKLKKQTLEREETEDVNFDDYISTAVLKLRATPTESNDATSTPDVEQVGRLVNSANDGGEVWKIEQHFGVYVLKLLSLVHSGGLSSRATNRLRLNKNKLGGLFIEIMKVDFTN